MTEDSKKTLGKVVQIDEKRINDHLGELVRGTFEETLNGLLEPRRTRDRQPGGCRRGSGQPRDRARQRHL